MWRRAIVGVALAGAVIVFGTFYLPGGGLDGPCIGPDGDFVRNVSEGGSASSHTTLFPPGIHCESETPDGRKVEKTYPGPVTWIAAALALIAPFATRRFVQLGRGMTLLGVS